MNDQMTGLQKVSAAQNHYNFFCKNEHNNPQRNSSDHQHKKCSRKLENLIHKRVENLSKIRNLMKASGNISINSIRNPYSDKKAESDHAVILLHIVLLPDRVNKPRH